MTGSGDDTATVDVDPPAELTIDRLGEADIPAALALSTEAGWNQIGVDWERLLALSEHCFAGRVGDELVATATAVTYGGVAWIGMVLVEERRRSRGYGTAMFRTALAAALEEGARVGLDATSLGVPVYQKEAFVPVGPIVRWVGVPDPPDGVVDTAAPEPLADPETVASLDRAACGVDRRPLLERLLSEAGTTGLLVRGDDGIRGYAVRRPGREHDHLGPVIADDRATVRALLGAAGRRSETTLLFDALAGVDSPLAATLEDTGLSVQRELVRMTHGRQRDLLDGARVAAGAGFELG